MNNNEIYYKRGLFQIDKLLSYFSNDKSFYNKRVEYITKELKRFINFYDVVIKDTNSFILSGLIALLGMNKENVEKLDKNASYNFTRFDSKDMKTNKAFKDYVPDFEKDRIINTKYDAWLNVTNLEHPTIDYMYNVRNGLLHSEYDFYDDRGSVIYIKNGNYTKFEGKILLNYFKEFCLFYFGNSSWTGLSENTNIYNLDFDNGNTAFSLSELDKVLNNLEIINVQYKLKENNTSIISPEEKLYKKTITDNRKNVYDVIDKIYRNSTDAYSVSVSKLSLEQKTMAKKMIFHYYDSEFFSLDCDMQTSIIVNICRYMLDSRTLISEWIVDYINLLFSIKMLTNIHLANKCGMLKFNYSLDDFLQHVYEENDKRSVFVARTSLLIVKAYHVLYRLQNKSFESIDYNNINFNFGCADYTYTRIDIDGTTKINDFSDDITKLSSKFPLLSDSELNNYAVCEIVRDALSHGNINIEIKLDDNDNVVEYIVFNDSYHSKTRKLEMTLDKFEKFLLSEAFLTKKCVIKKDDVKVKKI